MKPSLAQNYTYHLFNQMFTIGMPVLMAPYLARVLTETGSGLYSYAAAVLSCFTLFASLGFSNYAQRLVASHQGDEAQQARDFWEVFFARLIPAGIVLILYLVLVGFGAFDAVASGNSGLAGAASAVDSSVASGLVDAVSSSASAGKTLMLILAVELAGVSFDLSFFFHGNENFRTQVLCSVSARAVGIVCIFIFVRTPADLNKYALIQVLSLVAGYALMWINLPKYVFGHVEKLQVLRHLRPALLLFLPTIAMAIYTSLDKVLIGAITHSAAENGNYEYAERLVKAALTAVTAMGMVAMPHNSKSFADGDIADVRSAAAKAVRFVLLLGVPLCFGLIAVADQVVPWYLGDGFDKAADLMCVLSPIILIIGLSNVFGLQYLVPTHRDKRFALCVSVGAGVNFILNLLLIPGLKSLGAAIATAIAETVVTVSMYLSVRRELPLRTLFTGVWRYFAAGIVMFVPVYFVSGALPARIWATAICVVLGALLYFGALWLFGEFRKDV